VTAGFFAVWFRRLTKTNLHHNAFSAHLHDHVKRVLFGVIEHFNKLDEVRVIQLLHDGDFFANQIEGVAHLTGTRTSRMGG
jgi:hypothetical protein